MERFFLGFQLQAPWPELWPAGRLLAEEHRHLTTSFLGQCKPPSRPTFRITTAPSGVFDAPVFLPERHAHVAAWHVQFLRGAEFVEQIRADCGETGPWIPHVTLARRPFRAQDWRNAFVPLPFYCTHYTLFKSAGELRYEPLWQISLPPPFEEIEHTADRAYRIYGHNWSDRAYHALLALAFLCPPLLRIEVHGDSRQSLVASLNRAIAQVDAEQGCPIKAVSYHGVETERAWEMIIDV